MKDLNLKRTIPLVGFGTFVLVGCGGRTLDNSGGTGANRLSDENFDDALFSSFVDFCQRADRCGYSDYSEPKECADYYTDYFDEAYDLDSKECRRLALSAVDCFASLQSCSESAYYDCIAELYDFTDACSDYDYYEY